MSNVKEKIKAVTSMRLFLPIVCLIAVLLVNLITTPGFSRSPLTMAYCMAML